MQKQLNSDKEFINFYYDKYETYEECLEVCMINMLKLI